MKNPINNILILLGTLLCFIYSSCVLAEQDLGQVAQNLLEPVIIVSDFILTACFILGGSFIFTAIIKYVEYRRNPLAVPISTVIFLAVAGILLILLPFLSTYTGSGLQYSLFQQ